jgi:hypothetical protein
LAETRGTPLEAEAERELDAVRRRYREVRESDWASVRREIDDAAAREEFQRALQAVDAARPRHAGPDWTVPLDRKREEVHARAAAAYAELKERAVEARKSGRADDVAALQARLARWGLPLFRQDLENELAVTAPPPPPVPPEVQAYRRAWAGAAFLARARDFPGALAALQAAGAAVSDAALKSEAAADLEAFRYAAALSAEVIQAIARAPKGKALSLAYRDAEGRPRRADGSVVRADAAVIELEKDRRSVAVELGEVLAGPTAGTLREKGLSPAETRAAAVLSLLEGDLEAAGRAPEEVKRLIPEKYWAFASAAPEGDEAAREAVARALFFAARSEYEDFATVSEAVRKYGVLLREFDSAGVVRRNRGLVAQRSEGGKEFLFLAEDLEGSGGFRFAEPKAGACWTLEVDPAGPGPKDGRLDIVFSVLPATAYRGWVYAGACCGERLGFQLQSLEGAEVSVPVKASLSVLPKAHASHAGKKDPIRWGWFPLPVPAFSTAGPKTLRLASSQAGFSVAVVFLSALAHAPPRDSVVKEAERARGEPAPERSPRSLRDGLVGYWRFEDPADRAEDSSGHGRHGTPRSTPGRAPGRAGAALELDGDDDFVECPALPALAGGGPMSVSLWVRCKSAPVQFESPFGNTSSGDWLDGYGVFFNSAQEVRFYAGNWEKNVAAAPIEPGRWNHVVGVFDGKLVRIYVNGVEGKSAAPQVPVKGSAGGVLLGRQPGGTREHTLGGWLDEVRVYGRALAAAEIEALFRGRSR